MVIVAEHCPTRPKATTASRRDPTGSSYPTGEMASAEEARLD